MSAHDVGGRFFDDGTLAIDVTDRSYDHWERSVHAIMTVLVDKGMLTVDELRRGVEALPSETYVRWGYYEKWAAAICAVLVERGLLTSPEIDGALGIRPPLSSDHPAFRTGSRVQVRKEQTGCYWRKPHLRVPGYVFGAQGIVERYCGKFSDPEFAAYRSLAQKEHLYRVRFQSADLWPEGAGTFSSAGGDGDTVDVEVYEPWLTLVSDGTACSSGSLVEMESTLFPSSHICGYGGSRRVDEGAQTRHRKDLRNENDHVHEERVVVEQNALEREGPETIGRRVAEALVSICTAKGIVNRTVLTRAIETVDRLGTSVGGNLIGPVIVAKAWVDGGFMRRLLHDASAALGEIGVNASNNTAVTKLTAVENTKAVHNVVVCTLCSCYPLSILGLSPPWYKSRSYRARVVREPRKVLEEFGTEIPADVVIRVHDSTADLRYIVIPQRPNGTDGWDETKLRKLVTRDSMIGVKRALNVSEPKARVMMN